MRYAGIGWGPDGYQVETVDEEGRRCGPAVSFGPARIADLVAHVRGTDRVAAVIDSTNGIVDGQLMAAGVTVYRADPPLLPGRPELGSAPAIDIDDVLLALRLDHGQTLALLTDRRLRPRPDDVPAYRVCAHRSHTVGDVATELDVPMLQAAMSLARLEQSGWLMQVDGWFESVGSPLR